nr:hypothetical protein [Geothrix sp. 21YS21S-4]
MVFFNHATRQMTAKIVYYGPGLCGKTTNLNTIYGKTSQKARGEMVSLNTETDRTLFFDLLPMDVGMVGGFKTKLQLYTVPGQVFYNSTRKLVLKGVDGIVFVVDSQVPMLEAGRESWLNLEGNLRELGLDLHAVPLVFQWNKRDLKNVVPIEELEAAFNPRGLPSFQSVASDGTGVFETLRGITKLALSHIKLNVLGDGPAARIAEAPLPAPEPVISSSAPSPLTLSDLPSVSDLLDMEAPLPVVPPPVLPLPDEDDEGGLVIEAPHLPEPPAAILPPVAPPAEPERPFEGNRPQAGPLRPAAPKADPFAAFASLKVEAKRPVPRAPVDPQAALSTFLGELTQAGRQGALSVLRLDLPPEVEGEDVEVLVEVRLKGRTVAEGRVQRSAPAKGATAKLNVELKRG